MKKILIVFFIIISAVAGKGQNLVPNGDFEQFTGCPNGYDQINLALFFSTPTLGGTDYFNACDITSFTGVPYNFKGYQPAHSGAAYMGMHRYYYPTSPDYREYVTSSLTSPLVSNTCYHFEMYINLSSQSQYTSHNIGVYFSDTLITGITNYFPLPYIPQITNLPGNNPDTITWLLVSGNYTAVGGENYITIGNFDNDSTTTIIMVNPSGQFSESYIYIDDISLTLCTGIEEQTNSEAITIYPNPVKDELHVQSSKFKIGEKAEIKIYDVMGKEILKSLIQNPETAINLQSLKSGIYFMEINNGTNLIRKKFVKESVR